jgi:enoyl-CoA hydratase
MTDWQTVRYEKDGRIATITLNRPDKLNAINDALFHDLGAALEEADRDWDVWVVVLKGSGRAFCAGVDLSGQGTDVVMPPDPRAREFMGRFYEGEERRIEWWLQLFHYIKPTIAAVHGYALGWGAELAMACETSIVAADAIIGDPSIRMGYASHSPLWMWKAGPRLAKDLLYTGRYIDGQEAVRIGLMTRAVPRDQLDDDVATAATVMANRGGIVGFDGRWLFRKAWSPVNEEAAGMTATWKFAAHMHALSAIQRRRFREGEFHFHERRDAVGLRAALVERDAAHAELFPYGLRRRTP